MSEHPSFTLAKSLPEPWCSHFAHTVEQAREWQPEIRRRALASTVLCVAKTRVEVGWAAYCAGVSGHNHDNEWRAVLSQGSKLDERIARVIFPEFDDVRYSP